MRRTANRRRHGLSGGAELFDRVANCVRIHTVPLEVPPGEHRRQFDLIIRVDAEVELDSNDDRIVTATSGVLFNWYAFLVQLIEGEYAATAAWGADNNKVVASV